MRAKFRKVPYAIKSSQLLVRDIIEPYFYNPYHYHPEYELVAIIRGTGTRYIGDSIEAFREGDVVLVGANLAHSWRCDDIYYREDTDLTARAVIIQFGKNFLGQDIWHLKVMGHIKKLLYDSGKGVKIKGKTENNIKNRMLNMLNYGSIDQIACLLSILDTISKMDEQQLLASPGFTSIANTPDKAKINKVCSFVINNFQDDISLQEAANITHMAPQSFCRFFKKETHKTFVSYLNEVRVGYACKLLINNSFCISQVALESGFNTISYFNRKFKEIKGQTPSEYRTRFNRT